jgi:membrane associated rhomboid family serine protease
VRPACDWPHRRRPHLFARPDTPPTRLTESHRSFGAAYCWAYTGHGGYSLTVSGAAHQYSSSSPHLKHLDTVRGISLPNSQRVSLSHLSPGQSVELNHSLLFSRLQLTLLSTKVSEKSAPRAHVLPINRWWPTNINHSRSSPINTPSKMSLFQRLTKSIRPTTFNPTSTLQTSLRTSGRPLSARKSITPDFYTSSIHRAGTGRRFYNSYSYERTSNINTKIIYAIIGVNSAVFLYAGYAEQEAKQGHPGRLRQFYETFPLNYDGVMKDGRWWTPVTSIFTHTQPMHLLGNMFFLYFLGDMVAKTPGMTPTGMLVLIFGSGLLGMAGFLYKRHEKIKETTNTSVFGTKQTLYDSVYALGFSGANMGIGAVATILYPRTKVLIYGILPMPLWLMMSCYALYDGYYLNDSSSRIAHEGHIGGLIFGVAYHFAKMRGLRF